MSPDIKQKIALGIFIPLLLAFIWFIFAKGRMIWLHVDSDVPVSSQEARTTEAVTVGRNNQEILSKTLSNVDRAVQELERQRQELRQAPVRGC